ncbi:MAG: acetylxylan esterase [Bacillota bacterium]|nr:acetylxylan esterase [Bacillota bacterium]
MKIPENNPTQHSGKDQKQIDKCLITFNVFEAYDRRFCQAMLEMPLLKPWIDSDRAVIIQKVRQCLRIEDRLIPKIMAEPARTIRKDGYSVNLLQATSWPGVKCAANLYCPDRPTGRFPLVLLCCGHGADGKLNPGYQAMAIRLARQGAMVLVPDNIGQGERIPMGHKEPVIPFACGLSIQGLIVMETMAWLRWAMADRRVDADRLGAIGNSGGGTLTLFLAALCPELAVLSSSGYPSSFAYIARKEKKHCHCNLLPGIVGQIEMWQILGLFAPKPLFIFQGSNDHLFPEDLFFKITRQLKTVYASFNADQQLRWASIEGPHSWFVEKRHQLANFLAETLQLDPPELLRDDLTDCLATSATCYPQWPENALNLDDLAVQLTGIKPNKDITLWDVFPPDVTLPADQFTGLRGDYRQIFAQYEAFLPART